MTTLIVVIGWTVLILGWEGYVVITGDASTVSRAVDRVSNALPFLTYALGALVSHWTIQPPAQYTVADHLGEPVEVALVVFVGALVYVSMAGIMHVPWWAHLAVLQLGVFVGAFGWTIGV